jgi:hypothetical protein
MPSQSFSESEQREQGCAMSRYRNVQVKMWGDEKFKELSPLPPSGQSLWVYLLTGPQTSVIPGLFEASEMGLAGALGWTLEAFRKAFREVLAQGMAKADWKANLVYLPMGAKYNKPVSPNVVRHWGDEWEVLPECDLKREAYEGLKAYMAELAPGFGKAFDEVISKPLRKASVKASNKTMRIQEQEQEQEESKSKSKPLSSLAVSRTDAVTAIFEFWQQTMTMPSASLDEKRKRTINRALKGYSPQDLCKAILGCSRSPYHMGLNDRSTKYNSLELILRNADKIDAFMQMAVSPPSPTNGYAHLTPAQKRQAESEANVRAFLAGTPDDQANVVDMERH